MSFVQNMRVMKQKLEEFETLLEDDELHPMNQAFIENDIKEIEEEIKSMYEDRDYFYELVDDLETYEVEYKNSFPHLDKEEKKNLIELIEFIYHELQVIYDKDPESWPPGLFHCPQCLRGEYCHEMEFEAELEEDARKEYWKEQMRDLRD